MTNVQVGDIVRCPCCSCDCEVVDVVIARWGTVAEVYPQDLSHPKHWHREEDLTTVSQYVPAITAFSKGDRVQCQCPNVGLSSIVQVISGYTGVINYYQLDNHSGIYALHPEKDLTLAPPSYTTFPTLSAPITVPPAVTLKSARAARSYQTQGLFNITPNTYTPWIGRDTSLWTYGPEVRDGPKSLKCDCGSHVALGIEPYAPGHSDWCSVSAMNAEDLGDNSDF